MSVYITPFESEDAFLPEEFLKKHHFFEIHYRQIEGPLGFGIDSISESILFAMFEGTTWFDVLETKTDRFFVIDYDVFQKNKYRSIGVYFNDSSFIKNEIKKEKKFIQIEKKNKILVRNNRPKEFSEPSIFKDLYDMDSHNFNINSIELLMKNDVGFAIRCGGHESKIFIMAGSVFVEKLKEACLRIGEEIIWVDSPDMIPSW